MSTNYLALGLVLEAAAGRHRVLLRRHVVRPFGLSETTFEPRRVSGAHLHGHTRASRDGIATGLRDTSARWPLGLGRWCRGLDGGRSRPPLRAAPGRGARRPHEAGGRRPLRPRPRAVRDDVRRRRGPHGQPPRDDLGRRSARLSALVRRGHSYPLTPSRERAFQRLLGKPCPLRIGPVRRRPAATTVCSAGVRDARTGSPD